MTFSRQLRIAGFVAACAIASADSAFASGQAADSAAPGAGASAPGQLARGDHAPEDGARHGFGESRPGAPGLDGPSPDEFHPRGPGGFGLFGRLHHLNLSEAQQDKLFALTHAAAPQQRNQEKAERKARDTLRALGASPRFDEGKANAAARELGQAIANGALLRARLESQLLAVLTPEQREQMRRPRPPGPPDRAPAG